MSITDIEVGAIPLLEWSDEQLSVNVDIIDRQHRRLIDIINELHRAMNANHGEAILGEILMKLEHYTYYHFDTEEAYFKQSQYPELAAHKSQHDLLRSQVEKLEERYEQKDKMLAAKVMDLLKTWLIDHIIGSDRRFGTFLNKKNLNHT